jgi:chemotaxis protein MotB
MSAGKKKGKKHEEHADERWLLTYADMITLLMALFIVMWSMANVNTSKFEALSASLKDAFSGKILSGGTSIMATGGSSENQEAAKEDPIAAIRPAVGSASGDGTRTDAAQKETEDLKELKEQIDAWASSHGLSKDVQVELVRRGLIVRVLTDKVLFNSGSATLKPQSADLLDTLSRVLKENVRNPIQVEGNTDNVPVTGRYPSNWELSADRATQVVKALIRRGVWSGRLGAAGYASEHPIATNETPSGRALNRRVEIVVLRKNQVSQGG